MFFRVLIVPPENFMQPIAEVLSSKREPPRITQEYLGRQRRHWPHSEMRHELLRVGTLVSLLGNLLRQRFDFPFHLLVWSFHRKDRCSIPLVRNRRGVPFHSCEGRRGCLYGISRWHGFRRERETQTR